uniref:C3H1-type domain-containing protein n=2 Tax=Octactis speculum TaxID=3111310 RepID=A0A7S2CLD0_9STRA|mmetsp:Transcript_37529/g.50802  ORF Transcript_37529/g.50802 Transcript_37529/m.50802 type:complete len:116 (+) Transcript_37529:160-507(+)
MEDQKAATVRLCPVCRVTANYVIPAARIPRDRLQKEAIISEYRNAISRKPCRNFSRDGSCPFGSSCFYAHLKPDGTPADPIEIPRFRLAQDGSSHSVKEVTLSSFFDDRSPQGFT